jgi:ribosomal protein L13E
LAAAAFDVPSLLSSGFSVSELKREGFTLQQLKTGGCSAQQLKGAVFSAVELAAAAFDVPSLLSDGFSVSELKREGFTSQQLKTGGCSAQQMREAHFGAEELKAAGYDIPVLITAGYSVSELKGAGFTASQLKAAGLSAQQLFGGNFSDLELKEAEFDVADFYSIISVQTATPDAFAQAKAYYNDVEFASQLCAEFAAAESSNPALSVPLAEAHKMLGRIVEHNPLLKSSTPDRQPAWPLHDALIRFDLPLQRWTTQFLVTKKWFPRFFVLRGSRLYYSKGEKSEADSHEGALAFMRSNPAPDGHYCMDLKGVCARCVAADFAWRVCDTRAQAAVSRAAARPSMGRRSRWRSSFLQGTRYISMRALLCTHVTRHHAGSKGCVPCCCR